MKLCKGCKHLVHAPSVDVCKADDGQFVRVVNPYSGRVSYEPVGGSTKSIMRPTIIEMRSERGKCGPDAKLYEPNLWARFWRWVTR